MEARLDGRIVLVTGAAQGIGFAIAREAATSGAAGVMLTDRDAAKGQAALAEIEASSAAAGFVQADLKDVSAPARIFAAALARFGRVDGLANAAGMTDRASLTDATPDLWSDVFAVNARAPFFLMQELARHVRATGNPAGNPGAVVNILSMNIYGGTADLAVYSASKAALAISTKSAAHAHRFDRMRVNGINLGWAETPAEHQMQAVTLQRGAAWRDQAAAKLPFGRLIQPEDVARLAIFLLSDASLPMTGALIDQEQWVIGPRD
jgi:NAD(P)-dependent dehydrogenase (short-subunit alcohol dehydrogenase family)